MYHKLPVNEILASLDTNPETGLSDKEASLRGAESRRPTDNSSFFKFAKSAVSRPVLYMLIASSVISALLGGFIEAVLILAVVVLNIIFSAEVRRRAYRVISSAVNDSVTNATVLRNGAKMILSSSSLVVGDIVTLKPGRVVPADLRLISTDHLYLDESAIGGSDSARKNADEVLPAKTPLSERTNCAFAGTIVARGRAEGVVVATGMSTELSRRTRNINSPQKEVSPVFKSANATVRRASTWTAFSALVIFIVSLIYGESLFSTVLLTLALACAIFPESIYTSALTALSRGAELLRHFGFSAKDMKSIETLGDTSVFITDIPHLGVSKTYTNGRIHKPEDEDTTPFIYGLLLCDALSPSLSSYASHRCDEASVREAFPKLGELMGEVYTSLHRTGNMTVSYTGGDAEEILYRSKKIWDLGKIRSLTDFDREEINENIRALTREGYHLTAIGMRSGDDVPCDTNLVFLGIAATSADSGEETNPDVKKLHASRVRTYLLTCSDAIRARLGASMLGIKSDNILLGRDVMRMENIEIRRALSSVCVFAGLSPSDKARIISILEDMGKTVCMLGEDSSDAAALSAASVGISSVRAKDAAKNASDIVFDGTTSADRAIYLGKRIRSSGERAKAYLLATNVSEVVAVLLSLLCGFGFPLGALQILLINLITDTFPVFAISRAARGGEVKGILLLVLGIVIGVLAPFVWKLSMSYFMVSETLASWITFGYLTVFELVLMIPSIFLGRE